MVEPVLPDEQPPYPLYARVVGGQHDETIVFLPGFGGAHTAWNNDFLALGERYRLILVDTLGFGRSPKPSIDYRLEDHLAALHATVQHENAGIVHLVGHSMGGILALAYARQWPAQIGKLVLLATPFYRDAAEARRIVAGSSLFNRLFAMDNGLAHAVCTMMCMTRPLLLRVVPRVVHDVPALVAQDSLRHTWTSYARTLQHVIFETPTSKLIREIRCPTQIIQGTADAVAPIALTREAVAGLPLVALTTLPAEHRFVFTHSAALAAMVDAFIRGLPLPVPRS
jgi:pimeloyl-ACP methyl ester carboxylesterase